MTLKSYRMSEKMSENWMKNEKSYHYNCVLHPRGRIGW
jgi:hypothetical protein